MNVRTALQTPVMIRAVLDATGMELITAHASVSSGANLDLATMIRKISLVRPGEPPASLVRMP
jgi:hypothetical protein